MNIEQLAVMGIVIFGFMAVVHLLGAVRTFRKTTRPNRFQRVRRLVSSPESAKAIAESVVRELMDKYPEEIASSRKQRKLTEKMEQALEEARIYYLGRVEPRHRALFTLTVDEIIFQKEDGDKP